MPKADKDTKGKHKKKQKPENKKADKKSRTAKSEAKREKKAQKAKHSEAAKAGKGLSASSEPVLRIGKGDRLADLKCIPCRGGVPPLTLSQIEALLPRLSEWKAINGHHLERNFKFADFAQALDFTIQIGEVAEREQHHPDIYLAWGKVGVKIWTHKIDGLTESDFVLAAKIDDLI